MSGFWYDSESARLAYISYRSNRKNMLGVRFSHFDPRADIEADAEEHRHPPFSERDLVFTDLQFNSGHAADAPPCRSRRPGLRSGTGPRTRIMTPRWRGKPAACSRNS